MVEFTVVDRIMFFIVALALFFIPILLIGYPLAYLINHFKTQTIWYWSFVKRYHRTASRYDIRYAIICAIQDILVIVIIVLEIIILFKYYPWEIMLWFME